MDARQLRYHLKGVLNGKDVLSVARLSGSWGSLYFGDEQNELAEGQNFLKELNSFKIGTDCPRLNCRYCRFRRSSLSKGSAPRNVSMTKPDDLSSEGGSEVVVIMYWNSGSADSFSRLRDEAKPA